MKKLVLLLLLTGCAGRWDPNQSASIVDIQQEILNLDCDIIALETLQRDIEWFLLYTEGRGHQKAVLDMVKYIEESVNELAERPDPSPVYCSAKKELLMDQIDVASKAVLRRLK